MNNKLRLELKRMMKSDQSMIRSGKWSPSATKRNTARLKEIIEEHGWPSSQLVGVNGESAAWLLVQHSDYDVKFQEKCLKLLKSLQKTKNRKKLIAYLTDRVLVNRKRKQIYGTQFRKGKPRPIKDEKNLEKRRKQMGLGPFEDYKKRMERYAKQD